MAVPPIAVLASLILTVMPLCAQAARGAYTVDQAARGKSLYGQYCAGCHGEMLEGGAAPALAGETFIKSWGQSTRTVDDLFYVMSSSMPKPASGSLKPGEYLELLAFVLSRSARQSCRRRDHRRDHNRRQRADFQRNRACAHEFRRRPKPR